MGAVLLREWRRRSAFAPLANADTYAEIPKCCSLSPPIYLKAPRYSNAYTSTPEPSNVRTYLLITVMAMNSCYRFLTAWFQLTPDSMMISSDPIRNDSECRCLSWTKPVHAPLLVITSTTSGEALTKGHFIGFRSSTLELAPGHCILHQSNRTLKFDIPFTIRGL